MLFAAWTETMKLKLEGVGFSAHAHHMYPWLVICMWRSPECTTKPSTGIPYIALRCDSTSTRPLGCTLSNPKGPEYL